MTNNTEHPESVHSIVVGVDGSTGSLPALRFAIDEARLRDAEVRAVIAWQFPASYGSWPAVPLDDFDPRRVAHETLGDAIHAVLTPEDEAVRLVPTVVEGHAAAVLVHAAESADLLVVGSRGHGGFAGLLLGSVSHFCVHHCRRPVVVVHPQRQRDEQPEPALAASAH